MYGENYQRMELRMLMKKAAMEDLQKARVVVRVVVVQFGPRNGVRLIASVPGHHSGSNLKKWGHMKLRSVLEQCNFDEECQKFPLVYQFSSLGSVDEKWMAELKSSMSSGSLEDKTPPRLGRATDHMAYCRRCRMLSRRAMHLEMRFQAH
ncbi:hypothetical protein Nepgr_030357 [Nepenthes gracilis]|uniref:Uncharacterized protein n=1 Tax=Nepenthes gracilis TaxID=150966 RepID=A0AAD3Y5Z6_NEPGR|nr:hypothetical protein Nepgr_030357 [Nepenthes gracilis]